MDKPGFTYKDHFYPYVTKFRIGDPVLVAEVTGLAWNDYTELVDSNDPRALAGLVAVAIWQQHPTWRRERVLRYVEEIVIEDLVFSTPEEDEGDAVPPITADDTGITDVSPATLTPISEPQAASDETPAPTGRPLSAIS